MADDRGKRPKVYDETMQVRIRSKNPMIERKPSEPALSDRGDSEATVAATGPEMRVAAQMSADGMSLYEQIEHTDRTDEIERAARELAEATQRVRPRAPMALEDTKSMVVEAPKVAEPKKPKAPRREAPKTAPKKKPEARAEAVLDPVPRRKGGFIDEEETLIASEPPQRVGDLEKANQRFTESDEHIPTLVPHPSERAQAVLVRRSVPKQKEEEEVGIDLGVVPRRYLGAPGTQGAGAEVHRQLVDRIERGLPEVRAAPLKILRAELSADLLLSLDEILAGQHEQRATDGSVSPKRALEHLINEKSYQSLVPRERARLLMPIAEDPRDISTIKSGIAILKTRLVERLSEHVRGKLLDLFGTLDPDARATLAQLSARQLRGRSVLEDRDPRDISLIERLNQLVHGDPIPELLETHGVRRERIVKLVLTALANPAKLSFEEGSPGVISTIEFALADGSPAEYARLWTEIVSRACAAELSGGGRLELSGRVTANVSFTNQITPLRIALDQLPELAHPRARKPHPDFVMPGGHGIDADVVSRALAIVYGPGFTVAAGLDTAIRHLDRVARDPHRTPPVFVSLLYDRGERLFVFDHFEEGSVFLRAPHGRSTKRAGAFRSDPVRAVVDPDTGLESIPRTDFDAAVGVALVPRT